MNPHLRTTQFSRLPPIVPSHDQLSASIVHRANGFPYSRVLDAHHSCVNALTFSSRGGRFLASGGDDLQILLWDFHQDDVKTPSYSLKGPKRNIFSLQFSANNKYLFSGGSSETILRYDTTSLGSSVEPFTRYTPSDVFRDHGDSIRAISCHPIQDDIFISASEDGTIRRHDVRQPHPSLSAQHFISMKHEVTGVQYHPNMEHLFVMSDGTGTVLLRDARMAFTNIRKMANNGDGIDGTIQGYNTKITRRTSQRLANPDASSVCFDKEGTRIAVTFSNFYPTIYSLSDPDPLAVLNGQNLPDGTPHPPNERTYVNSCTMKHGAFGGPGDDLYAAGSDDFRGYVWKLPSVESLKNQREQLSAEEWAGGQSTDSLKIAFTESRAGPKILPVEISTPFCRLTGHKSIVNTIVFHPHFLNVVTAGVEKRIVLHSPTPSSPCTQNLQPSPTHVRRLLDENSELDSMSYMAAILGVRRPLSLANLRSDSEEEEDDPEERQTLSLFDHLLREESGVDIFTSRVWRSPDSSDDDGEDEDEEEDSAAHMSTDDSDDEVDIDIL